MNRSDMLLKIDGLRKTSRVPWPVLAEIYRAETGEDVGPAKLRARVKSCAYRRRRKMRREMLMELEKIDLVERGEDVYARSSSKGGFLGKVLSWLKALFGKTEKRIRLDWCWGNCNGANAVEDTSPTGYRLTKFTFDGKTVRFDGVGAMWGYDHTHHDARNCLFLRDGDKYVGGFFEWGDPSRKSREIKNITSKYGGWDPSRLAKAAEFAFCIADKAGKRRTNVLTFRR